MPIRMSGMVSGLDTEALVSAMVSSYSVKADKYKKAQTKLTWKTEAWSGINSKIKSLYNSASSLRLSSAYSLKKTKVSDATKASVTATSDAINGSQSLKIKQLAKSGYLTGAKLDDSVTSSSTLADLGFSDGSASIEVKVGAKTKTLTFDSDTKISKVISDLNDAGVKANFDAKNKRIFVASANSGESSNFDLTGVDGNGVSALAVLGLSTSSTASYAAAASYAVESAGAFDETATKSSILQILKDLQSNKAQKDELTTDNKELTDHINYSKAKNANDTAATDKYNSAKDYVAAKAALAALAEGETDAASQAVVDAYEAANPDITEDDAKKIVSTYESNKAVIDEYESLNAGATVLDETGIDAANATIEANKSTITSLENAIKKYKRFDLGDFTGLDDAALEAKATEFTTATKTAYDIVKGNSAAPATGKAIKIEGQDAIIELNGAEFTSDSNTITVNGLSITATGVTGDEEIQITTDTDTQGLYDKIKDFLSQYNSVINEMTKLYNAESAGGYEPLTDDEKDQMSETEIEKWETKIKDSLLRRDTQLGSLLSSMNNAMMKTYTVDGKSIGLSAFGIHTLGTLNSATNEQYAYHIDGDSEDTTSAAGNADKLMAALKEDPEKVTELFKQVVAGLYKAVDAKMGSNTLSSKFYVYNDKEMASEYSSYTKLISRWEDKLSDMEDKYYKQFSNMESQLAKLQSNSSSVTSLLGM